MAVIVGLLMIPILILSAFAIDFGNAYSQSRALSTGADSASLAILNEAKAEGNKVGANSCNAYLAAFAAKYPTTSSLKAFAATYANANAPFGRTLTAADITDARVRCPNGNPGTLVADVSVMASVPTSLGNLVGVSQITSTKPAQAVLGVGGMSDCGLCVVGDGVHDLQNGDIAASGTSVSINGTLDSRNNGSIIITATGDILLEGATPRQGTFVPNPGEYQPPFSDPLASMPMPSFAGLPAGTNSCTQGPNRVYAALTPCASMTPGLYVLTGQTRFSGSETVNAFGSTLYFVCGTPSAPRVCASGGEVGGHVLFTGQSVLNYTAPTTAVNGGVPGLAIVADRNNTAEFSWRGQGATASTGTIYILNGALNYRGNGNGLSIDSLVVVGDLNFNGNPSAFKMTYSAQNNVSLPPGPSRLSQ